MTALPKSKWRWGGSFRKRPQQQETTTCKEAREARGKKKGTYRTAQDASREAPKAKWAEGHDRAEGHIQIVTSKKSQKKNQNPVGLTK